MPNEFVVTSFCLEISPIVSCSNHEGHLNNREASTTQNKAFQIPPLSVSACIGLIYTIVLKYGLPRLF